MAAPAIKTKLLDVMFPEPRVAERTKAKDSPSSLIMKALKALRIKRTGGDDFVDEEVPSPISSAASIDSPVSRLIASRRITPARAMLTPDIMHLFLKAGLNDAHKFDYGGLNPVATTPLASCTCHHAPLSLRGALLHKISSDVSRIIPASKHLSVIFYGSGHLGNETIISCDLLHKKHSDYTFHLVDPLYATPRIPVPEEDCGKKGIINDRVEKAMLAYESRLTYEVSDMGIPADESPSINCLFRTSNEDFLACSETPPQVFTMIDPGDAFTFGSKMARGFHECIKERRAPRAPCLIYILAKGKLYAKVLAATDDPETALSF